MKTRKKKTTLCFFRVFIIMYLKDALFNYKYNYL